MATVQALRKPPPRSPARMALADAIANHDATVALVDADKRALANTEQSVHACHREIERATVAIEDAKKATARHATAVAMGGAGPTPTSVKQARADLQDAEDALEAALSSAAELRSQRAST